MNVIVNGQNHSLGAANAAVTLQDLLGELGLGEGRIAVEVNAEIVPRSEHPQKVLQDGDRIEIVHAIGGG